jgi:hypothetical protein
MIYLSGGPPHQDMFDLKPDAPVEVAGVGLTQLRHGAGVGFPPRPLAIAWVAFSECSTRASPGGRAPSGRHFRSVGNLSWSPKSRTNL